MYSVPNKSVLSVEAEVGPGDSLHIARLISGQRGEKLHNRVQAGPLLGIVMTGLVVAADTAVF